MLIFFRHLFIYFFLSDMLIGLQVKYDLLYVLYIIIIIGIVMIFKDLSIQNLRCYIIWYGEWVTTMTDDDSFALRVN